MRAFTGSMLVVGAAVLLAVQTSCERSQTTETPRKAQSQSMNRGPTPNLDALSAVDGDVPREWSGLTMNLRPLPAGLEFGANGEPDEKAKLIAFLEGVQPLVERALAASELALEAFPDEPQRGSAQAADSYRHPLTAVKNLSRLLLTDASRCFERGDAHGALLRVAGAMRFANRLAAQKRMSCSGAAAGVIVQACSKLCGVAAARRGTADVAMLATTEAALNALDSGDPAGNTAVWERDARAAVAECREKYAVPGGPKKYAEMIRGSDASMASVLETFGGLAPQASFADRAASVKASDLASALEGSEASIGALVAAMKAGDDGAFERFFQVVRDDKTQILRVAMGMAPLVYGNAKLAREALGKAKAALHEMRE